VRRGFSCMLFPFLLKVPLLCTKDLPFLLLYFASSRGSDISLPAFLVTLKSPPPL
jgi:hypothetical protein